MTSSDQSRPAWKALDPVEFGDLMDFWAAQHWPLSREEVLRLAVERFGWEIEIDDGKAYLMNTVSGFTIPDVSAIGDPLSYLTLRVTDVIRDVTPQSTEFLGDAFALMVREGTARWGAPSMRETKGSASAHWSLPSGARIILNPGAKSVSGMFQTPEGVALDRRLGY